MGMDPAPFWANLYLYDYEQKYVSSLIKSNPVKARKFKYASRFIDDECNLNDNGEFGNSYQAIYPAELELKCEHQGTSATNLEIEISIIDGRFKYKLFDKRDSFPFDIVRMPNLGGNIPEHIFYGSFMAEVLRIGRATLYYEDFLPRVGQLLKRMCKQGGCKKKLLEHVKKAVVRFQDTFMKYNKTIQQIAIDVVA